MNWRLLLLVLFEIKSGKVFHQWGTITATRTTTSASICIPAGHWVCGRIKGERFEDWLRIFVSFCLCNSSYYYYCYWTEPRIVEKEKEKEKCCQMNPSSSCLFQSRSDYYYYYYCYFCYVAVVVVAVEAD